MNTISLRISLVAGLAFAAGFCAHGSSSATAQAPSPAPSPVAMPSAYVYNLASLNPQATPFPNARTQDISVASNATVTYFVGTVAAHYHTTANEIQYVISGTGTERFGSQPPVSIGPGTLLVIPPGTVHAGLEPKHGPLKLLVIKVPKQQPNDNHWVTPSSSRGY